LLSNKHFKNPDGLWNREFYFTVIFLNLTFIGSTNSKHMGFFFLVIALITAGLCLAMGSISLVNGLDRDGEKVDVVFGAMCIALFIFFLLPPVGFVLIDKAPYASGILFKRVFNFFYGGAMPWLILLYTGYKKKILPLIVSSLYLIAYLIMVFTTNESVSPLWMTFIVIALGIAGVYGFIAANFQWKSGDRKNARWLLFTMCIFMVFYLPTATNQFFGGNLGKMINAKIFYPINLFSLAFVLLMGIRLRANSTERFRLGRVLKSRDIRWSSFMQNMQMLVVHLDKAGIVMYINPYAVKLVGYREDSEVLGKNWFEHFLPSGESSLRRLHFQEVILKDEKTSYHKSEIVNRTGENKIISWSNLPVYDDENTLIGSISIGTDITEQEKSFLEIHELKAELEKEDLLLKGEPLPEWMQKEIIGKSQAIIYAIQKARQVAGTQATVLLEGETGVGKELFADLIQRTSLRSTLPYVKVNCSALPAELIEDELFGHEKGAFTGAIQPRKGRFEIANGGTIFLDELGELPLSLQPKLLRVLQNGEFERVGGQQTMKVDVRVIAATNRDLGKEVKEGRFRDDLFYRLNVFPITIPPLRSRKEDIPLLVQFYIDKKTKKHGKHFQNISKSDIHHLREYNWPGNIRELKNVIERAVISSENSTLKIGALEQGVDDSKMQSIHASSLEIVEKEHILKVLIDNNWRINGEHGAADVLAMHPSTLRSRMKKLNIFRTARESS
jgi:PAS domain S-box-containing protein